MRGYRAPSYSITPRSLWALDVLIEEGFAYDASIFPIHHDRYGIPVVAAARRTRIDRERGDDSSRRRRRPSAWGPFNLPVAGGGYFRILPYAWTRWGIARINRKEQRPAIFYMHPWEIDPDQPRLDVGRLRRFRHYRNLDQTEARLRALLTDFRFGTMQALVESTRALELDDRLALPYLW